MEQECQLPVLTAPTGTGSKTQVPHDVFRGKEENVSWNLSLDLARILEHISCYENCRNTFKWASHECPWSSAVNWKSQRQNLLKEKSLKLGREGQVILESHLLSGSLCLQHEAVTTCFVLLSQIQDVTLAKS